LVGWRWRALRETRKLGLKDGADGLARLVGDRDFPRLVRVGLEGDRVLKEAG
jgi:hypothetical protein